jgi:hypothetical protein
MPAAAFRASRPPKPARINFCALQRVFFRIDYLREFRWRYNRRRMQAVIFDMALVGMVS